MTRHTGDGKFGQEDDETASADQALLRWRERSAAAQKEPMDRSLARRENNDLTSLKKY